MPMRMAELKMKTFALLSAVVILRTVYGIQELYYVRLQRTILCVRASLTLFRN
jgi:hypothetical protein